MGKPYAAILSEFQGGAVIDDVLGSGDVKYHLGTSTDRELPDGRHDPPLAHRQPLAPRGGQPGGDGQGARQAEAEGRHRAHAGSWRILMHGDAAFIGQGVVHECLEMMELKGYRIGGTIHLIVNNQIGFTTSPAYSRSSPYPSDVARGVQCPVFHVNGDDPVAVTHVARLATEFRQQFKIDVVIDLWCYRRHGHNEGDEPGFTQPLMYKKIAQHPTVRQTYARRLEKEGVLEPRRGAGDLRRLHQAARGRARGRRAATRPTRPTGSRAPGAACARRRMEYERGSTAALGRDAARARPEDDRAAGGPERASAAAAGDRRRGARRSRRARGIDWATAEHLAFASLLVEGFPVRLSGEDVGRGTFSQRHAVIYDQTTEERYIPLPHLKPEQASFEVIDSILSEEGVLGFEYGYSLADPNCLTIWEAQFGDFANGAQVYYDQFISSGESKWLRLSRPRQPAAARLRGPGPGAQLGPARALPAALRREQHPGRLPEHARQLLPRPAPAAAPRVQEAPDRDDAEVAAAAQALRQHARRAGPGHELPPRAVGDPARARPSRGRAGDPVQRQGLLRPAAGARGARARRQGGADPARGARPLPRAGARGASCAAIRRPRATSGARRSRATWAPGSSWPRGSRT